MAEKVPINFDKLAKQRAALRRTLEKMGVVSADVLKKRRNDPSRLPTSSDPLKHLKGPSRKLAEAAAKMLHEADVQAEELRKKFNLSAKKLVKPEELQSGMTRTHEVRRSEWRKAREFMRNERDMMIRGRGIDVEKAVATIPTNEQATYKEILTLISEINEIKHLQHHLAREAQLRPESSDTNDVLLEQALAEKVAAAERKAALEKKDPIASRAAYLTSLKQGLHRPGHIAEVDSVDENLNQIANSMVRGRPMFLFGPTGTGKTALAQRAALHLTGKDPEMVYCSPQTRESNLWGTMGIKPASERTIKTEFVYGALARAMREGKVIIFDEFTALPQEVMPVLKGVMNAKVGDRRSIPGNGEPVTIAAGFQMIFTANLKSEKNPERQDIPPEMANEFFDNNLKISYPSAQETYEIMLARLMKNDGSADFSWHDLTVTLPKLCEALEEIQIAYTGRMREGAASSTGMLDATNKGPGLKKLVTSQRTVEAIFQSWQAEKRMSGNTLSFVEFLDQHLMTGLKFDVFSESDRTIAAKIFAWKGLLRTITPQQLDLPADIFNFDAAKSQRGDVAAKKKLTDESRKIRRISIMELAELDPWDTRKKPAAEAARGFRKNQGGKAEAAEGPESTMDAFVRALLENVNQNQSVQISRMSWVMSDPEQWNFRQMSNSIKPDEYGAYLQSVHEQHLQFGHLRIRTPKNMMGVGVVAMAGAAEKAREVSKQEGDILGGLTLMKWLVENQSTLQQTPDRLFFMEKERWYAFFGALLRNERGEWSVPCLRWDGSKLHAQLVSLNGGVWQDQYSPVFIENRLTAPLPPLPGQPAGAAPPITKPPPRPPASGSGPVPHPRGNPHAPPTGGARFHVPPTAATINAPRVPQQPNPLLNTASEMYRIILPNAYPSVITAVPQKITPSWYAQPSSVGSPGQFIYDPDMLVGKIRLFDQARFSRFSQHVGNTFGVVGADNAKSTTTAARVVPGIETISRIRQFTSTVPDSSPLKSGDTVYFFGSRIANEQGHWLIPGLRWDGSRFAVVAKTSADTWTDKDVAMAWDEPSNP